LKSVFRAGSIGILGALASIVFSVAPQQSSVDMRRMSFHNRLLLNRAIVSGLPTIEVLAITGERSPHGSDLTAQTVAAIERLGGRVLRAESDIGYLRLELPTEQILELAALESVVAYQISSLSRGAWYRDGPPLSNAQMFRGFETAPVSAGTPSEDDAGLPLLTPGEARAPAYTGDDQALTAWTQEHPTYDGRGVTIALVESALPSFTDPALQHARSLDGREIPKLAGILNAIDPSHADETRVRLRWTVATRSTWARVDGRTYIVPAPGTYRLGLFDVSGGGHVVHHFAVIEREDTREVRVDANGNGSFQDEPAVVDVNERFDPHMLTLRYPRQSDVSFVMSRGRESDVVHLYIGRSSHQTMTASIAAGQMTPAGLAFGVAPGARLLFVRKSSTDPGLGDTFEAFLEAARDPRVDVISVSGGFTLVPDGADEFAAIFFNRLIRTFGKPIVNAAGNTSHVLGSVHAYGDVLSAGGVISPATYSALYGGRPLDRAIVHPMSAAGPALDGAVKPDFLVPMERLAADLPWRSPIVRLPRSTPTRRVPAGYQISCCTSATSPYAAAVAALLISAAKQSGVPYSAARIGRAMRMSARPLPEVAAHLQGNGVLDVNAAWRVLVDHVDAPRIQASAQVIHPLAQYMAGGASGQGLFEFGQWFPGKKGRRTIALRRTSGPERPLTYRVSWTAGDGTFQSARTVTLPLDKVVPLDVEIEAKTAGAHSALLDLQDIESGASVFRSQATIAVAEPMPPGSRSIRVTGVVQPMKEQTHYFHVPPGTSAIGFELVVTRGSIGPTILQSHGLSGDYYMHVHPMNTFFVGPGRYHLMMPNPEPGTWTVKLDNRSVWADLPAAAGPHDDEDAEYALTVKLFSSAIQTRSATKGRIAVEIVNSGSALAEPVLEVLAGTLTSHRGAFRHVGLPILFEIVVPRSAADLLLDLRSPDTQGELYLYDCTTGECFSYDIAFPAATTQRLVVRKPAAGRWVAAVNAAPIPLGAGSFVFDTVITASKPVTAPIAQRGQDRWHADLEDLPTAVADGSGIPILLFQLLDRAAEREPAEHPWSTAPHYVQLRDRPVAIGIAIHRR
jgi:hypothetical protein